MTHFYMTMAHLIALVYCAGVNERENPKSRMKMFQSNIHYFMRIKMYIVFIEEIWVQIYAFRVHVCGYFWVQIYAFWVHVYGAVGCMYAVVGCKYAETFECMYAVVGCKVCGDLWVHA